MNSTPVLHENNLFMGDNGRLFCGACAGASAKYTGRDISGQPVIKITDKEAAEWRAIDLEPICETCNKGLAS